MLSVINAVTFNGFLSTEICCPQLSDILFSRVYPFFISKLFAQKKKI